MEGKDGRQEKEESLMQTIVPQRNILGGSIATSQAGESFLTPLATAPTGELVQGILHVPVNIAVNDLMLAALKSGGITNQAVLDSLCDRRVLNALKDPRVLDSLKDPRVLTALKEQKVLDALKLAEEEEVRKKKEQRKELLAQSLVATVLEGFKESLDASVNDAIYYGVFYDFEPGEEDDLEEEQECMEDNKETN